MFSPHSSASVGLQLELQITLSDRVVVVVVVVPGRNAGDVLRLLGIQPQLGTVMLPVLSEPLNWREAAPDRPQHNTDCRQDRKGASELCFSDGLMSLLDAG